MLLVLDWIELTDFGQKHRNCVLDGMVGPPCIRCIAPLCQLTSTIERSVAAVMWPYVRLMWPLAMMLMSGCQHVIRKAVGSYGEALFLAVYLAFADKSQVVCLQLSYSAWVLLWCTSDHPVQFRHYYQDVWNSWNSPGTWNCSWKYWKSLGI